MTIKLSDYLLTVDQGNGHTSAICFEHRQEVARAANLDQLKKLIEQLQLNNENCTALVSNVTKDQLHSPQLKFLEVAQWFTAGHFLDMPVHYSQSLGQDRYTCSYYAFKNYPNSWVIDSGTFTTIDLVDKNGMQGGYILPGLKLIQNTYASGQNLFHSSEIIWELPHQLPQDSKQAIDQGASLTFLAPILEALKQRPAQTLIVTGGNGPIVAEFLRSKLPSASIHFNPDLLHLSLLLISEAMTKR